MALWSFGRSRSEPPWWQRLGSTRLGVLFIGKVFSPLHRFLLRVTGGRLPIGKKKPVLLLTSTGRRTGLPRTVPLFYLRDGERFVVCNVNPGFERPNPWTLNLRADRHATIEVGGTRLDVLGREVDPEELDRYWPQLVEMWPAYERFFEEGGARSVFILEPETPK